MPHWTTSHNWAWVCRCATSQYYLPPPRQPNASPIELLVRWVPWLVFLPLDGQAATLLLPILVVHVALGRLIRAWLDAYYSTTSVGASLLLGWGTSPSALWIEGVVLVRENRAAAAFVPTLSRLCKHEEANWTSSRFLQVLLEHVIVSLEKSIDFSLGLDFLLHFQSYLLLAISIITSELDSTSISIVWHIAEWREPCALLPARARWSGHQTPLPLFLGWTLFHSDRVLLEYFYTLRCTEVLIWF